MFRQLIDEVQHLVDLHGFPPPPPPIPTVPPSSMTVLPPPPPPPPLQLHDHRLHFLNLDNNFFEKDYEDIRMKATKSRKTKRKKQKQIENPGLDKSLDTEIWRHFPEELYENVIARLPLATICRFRSVCQNWKSMLASNTFTLQCAQFMPPQPWFYIRYQEKHNTGAMYDPVSTKWYYHSISKIHSNRIGFPIASAGGLLCFNGDGRSFVVCNPLTNSFKKLPDRLTSFWSSQVVAMILNKKSNDGGYQIMLVASDGEYEVYDSIINKWTRVGSLPNCIKLSRSFKVRYNTVAGNGVIYFLRSDPHGIVSFDMESKVWKQYLVPIPPLSRDLSLVECGGRIMLVGLVTKSAASCVSVWELQKMTLLWKEVDRMPNVMSLEFYGKHVSLCCLGNGGLIMLVLRFGIKDRLVTYDVLKKEWLQVPNCVGAQFGFAIGAFHPSLTAVA